MTVGYAGAVRAAQEPAGARLAPAIDVEPYLGPVRRERCACGGDVVAPLGATPEVVMRRVGVHQASRQHAAWRERRGY